MESSAKVSAVVDLHGSQLTVNNDCGVLINDEDVKVFNAQQKISGIYTCHNSFMRSDSDV